MYRRRKFWSAQAMLAPGKPEAMLRARAGEARLRPQKAGARLPHSRIELWTPNCKPLHVYSLKRKSLPSRPRAEPGDEGSSSGTDTVLAKGTKTGSPLISLTEFSSLQAVLAGFLHKSWT
jgi:hypothetical protein